MKQVEPEVYLVASTVPNIDGMRAYLKQVGGEAWLDRVAGAAVESDAGGLTGVEAVLEFAGRLCYRSWEPGLNKNVTRVRANSSEYFDNVIRVRHGSVLEHSYMTFVLHNVSRVLTHEWVRHRAGCAISQESLRFVRLDELNIWFPEWFDADRYPELHRQAMKVITESETFQAMAAGPEGFILDGVYCQACGNTDPDPQMQGHGCTKCDGVFIAVPFHEKKMKTSFMRRFAPDGLATGLVWTANVRTIRHVIEMRTAPDAEEEIRIVADAVATLAKAEAPLLFADYRVEDGAWLTESRKV